MDQLRARFRSFGEEAAAKKTREGWVLKKETVTFADENTWSNRDSDVTPEEYRTWTSWTILGYWMSDALSAQTWSGASSIIAVGLTWLVHVESLHRPSVNGKSILTIGYCRREALYCLFLGILTIAIPLCLNGAAGAELHVPFPVVARSSFGFLFSKFPIVIRMITAMFWHGELLLQHPSTISSSDI